MSTLQKMLDDRRKQHDKETGKSKLEPVKVDPTPAPEPKKEQPKKGKK